MKKALVFTLVSLYKNFSQLQEREEKLHNVNLPKVSLIMEFYFKKNPKTVIVNKSAALRPPSGEVHLRPRHVSIREPFCEIS